MTFENLERLAIYVTLFFFSKLKLFLQIILVLISHNLYIPLHCLEIINFDSNLVLIDFNIYFSTRAVVVKAVNPFIHACFCTAT